MKSKFNNYTPEFIGSVLCLTLGMLSGYVANASDSAWYTNLSKPIFNPPNWIFGPVWTLIYIMMGIALGLLWKHKRKNKRLLGLFFLQLVLNLAWSPIFFYYQSIGGALLGICALWIAIVAFMFATHKDKNILLLFFPYIVWVSFAAFLNFSLYQLNS